MRASLPLWVGHAIGVAGLLLGAATLTLAPRLPLGWRAAAYLVAWFSLWFFPHCLTHYIVGRAVGIRFTGYFIGRTHLVKVVPGVVRPLIAWIPVLGIRVERSSLRAAAPKARYAMFASGAFASMLLPFAVPLGLALRGELGALGPFLALSLANLLLTALLSPRVGDIHKARRSLR